MAEPVAPLPDPSARLEAGYRTIEATRMRGLPVLNPALAVAAVGFAPWQGHWLGVVLSPWFMNLALAPRDPAAWQPLARGAKRHYRFPAGEFEFVGAQDPLTGELQLCSLFSPMERFVDQDSALATARFALEALMDPRNAPAEADLPVGAPGLPQGNPPATASPRVHAPAAGSPAGRAVDAAP